jgi:uncharacterized protein YndB with AHSA1/START domain
MTGYVATAETDIQAAPSQVWQALTDPERIKEWMFGSLVETDWQPGSPITWSGEFQGKSYQDKGEVLAFEPERLLRVTHFSPLTGGEDVPENYHAVEYRLEPRGTGTHLTISNDNNGSQQEADHATETWSTMLSGLKKYVEEA